MPWMTNSVDNVIMKIEVTVVADSEDMRTSHVIPARALIDVSQIASVFEYKTNPLDDSTKDYAIIQMKPAIGYLSEDEQTLVQEHQRLVVEENFDDIRSAIGQLETVIRARSD